ncbi:MAG: radical SAM protein, partial [Nanoarchaeota archaeon]|nr:radical SAM protein [Nanoarchaeota archaeon]
DLDKLEFTAWDLLPLANYWKLHYSHAPLSSKRYLPLLTSRGCPFGCRFCITSSANRGNWRSRSAKNVVDEIETFTKKFDVPEFHLEDLNPTVKK